MNKKIHLVLSLMILSFGQTIAQDKPGNENKLKLYKKGNTEIPLTFVNSDDSLPADFYIRRNSRIHYKIVDINKSLYNINFSGANKEEHSTVPKIFELFDKIDLSKVDTAMKNKTNTEGGAITDPILALLGKAFGRAEPKVSKYINERASLVSRMHQYNLAYKKLQGLNEHNKNLVLLSQDACRTFKLIDADKSTTTKTILSAHDYKGGATDFELRNGLRAAATQNLEQLDKLYAEIQELYDKVQLLKVESDAVVASEIKKLQKNAKALSEIAQAKEIDAKIQTSIEVSLAEIKQSKVQVDKLKEGDFTNNLIKTFDRINVSNWVYISPPFKATKDILEITIDIQPKQPLECSNFAEKFNGVYEGRVTGFKIDYSTGLFLLQGKNLFDRTYKTEPIEDDTVNNLLIQNANKTKVLPAIGALMHFYWKGRGFVNMSGSFGLSVNNETRLNYHGGVSALFGQEQRVILTFGATLSNVSMINDSYQAGQKIPKTVTTIPTSNYHRWGTFLALSWNLAAK